MKLRRLMDVITDPQRYSRRAAWIVSICIIVSVSILQGPTTSSWADDPIKPLPRDTPVPGEQPNKPTSIFVPLSSGELQKLNDIAQSAIKKSPVRIKAVTDTYHANIDTKEFASLAAGSITIGAPISFQVSQGISVTVITDRIKQGLSGSVAWDGHVQGDPNSSFHLRANIAKSSLFGDIRVRGRLYEIRPIGSGTHTIYTLDLKKLPPDHEPRRHKPPIGDVEHGPVDRHLLLPTTSYSVRPVTETSVLTPVELTLRPYAAEEVHIGQMDGIFVGSPEIDVMVVYTTAAGGMAGIGEIGEQICQAIKQVRSSFENSGVRAKIRLVYSHKLDYNESAYTDRSRLGNLNLILNDIRNRDTIKELRMQHGADVVSFWVSDNVGGGDYCGISPTIRYPPDQDVWSSAYSVVLRSCATSQLSFAHELGHLFGANHDRFNDRAGQSPKYNWGYVKADKGWRTIMAYNRNDCKPSPRSQGEPDCDRLMYWSNPTVTLPHSDDATGRPINAEISDCLPVSPAHDDPSDCKGPAYDALALNEAAESLAKFMPSKHASGDEICAP